jgi:tetratricopeptide (TPR) repeat protein
VPGFLENHERNVIPRWRDFWSTVELGELTVELPPGGMAHPAHDITSVKFDWEQNRSISFAGDLISAALVSGNIAAAKEASEFIVSLDERPPAQLKALAHRVLSGKSEPPRAPVAPVGPSSGPEFRRSAEISSARRSLRRYPSDAILWMDLAYLYAVRGISHKASSSARIALNLAPSNRFIVRSAARFLLHIDRLDMALDIIRRSPGYTRDPWLVAAEIAVSLSAKRTPWSTREAFSLLNRGNFGEHHLSELSSALGTLEFNAGNSSKAKKLIRRSLIKPNDNSLAQAKWISSDLWGANSPEISTVDTFQIARPYEAGSFEAFEQNDWQKSYRCSLLWLDDQPFSAWPARMAASLAANIFDDLETCERLAKLGLVTSPDDPALLINLAYSYACTGRSELALSQLSRIRPANSEDWVAAGIEANYGLVAFRGGNIEAGRKHYAEAVSKAEVVADKRVKLFALAHWALEEAELQDSNSENLFTEALQTAKQALGFDIPFRLAKFAEKISLKSNHRFDLTKILDTIRSSYP